MSHPACTLPPVPALPIRWAAPPVIAAAAHRMRLRTLDTVLSRRGGYLTQTCSCAELLATLVLSLAAPGTASDPPAGPPTRRHGSGSVFLNPGGPADHRLIVSPGHYSLAVYTALVEAGRLPAEALDSYGLPDSPLELIGAHDSPGFEIAGGSLGQGLSQGLGIALARQRLGDSGHTFVLLGDGELQEGQTWEAVQAAHHHFAAGLTIVVDANGQQVDGYVSDVMDIAQIEQRFTAFGAQVTTVDGHHVPQLIAALAQRPTAGCPAVVVARTDPARGVEAVRDLPPYRRHGLWFTAQHELAPFVAARQVLAEGLEMAR